MPRLAGIGVGLGYPTTRRRRRATVELCSLFAVSAGKFGLQDGDEITVFRLDPDRHIPVTKK